MLKKFTISVIEELVYDEILWAENSDDAKQIFLHNLKNDEYCGSAMIESFLIDDEEGNCIDVLDEEVN